MTKSVNGEQWNKAYVKTAFKDGVYSAASRMASTSNTFRLPGTVSLSLLGVISRQEIATRTLVNAATRYPVVARTIRSSAKQ